MFLFGLLGAPVFDGWLVTLPEASRKISSGYFFSLLGIFGILILLLLMFLSTHVKDYPTLLVGLGAKNFTEPKYFGEKNPKTPK